MSTRLQPALSPSGEPLPEKPQPTLSLAEDHRETAPAYTVGYGKPPTAHRFQKGRSGNPKGRPKKKKSVPQDWAHRAEDLIMAEAYRFVSLREGDQVIRLPAIQAILRRMGLDALKGNRYAQKALTDMVQTIETRDAALRQELFEEAFLYKQRCRQESERCDRLGLPRPTFIPHPDDLVIDVKTSSVRILGPMCEDEKKKWDWLAARRKEAQNAITEYQRELTEEPDNKFILDEIAHEERIFNLIDSGLPKRWK